MGKIMKCRVCQQDHEFKGGSLLCSDNCRRKHVEERNLRYAEWVRLPNRRYNREPTEDNLRELMLGRSRYHHWLKHGR